MKKISNPLTIVAIFSGIAEVAGTIVLPFVNSELQNIFIWYVMLFPVALVILFFLTWNFNAKVLYAPNDFLDENNYMEALNLFYGIKRTVESGKESEEVNKEITDKVYSSVIKQIEKLEKPRNEYINISSKIPKEISTKPILNILDELKNSALNWNTYSDKINKDIHIRKDEKYKS